MPDPDVEPRIPPVVACEASGAQLAALEPLGAMASLNIFGTLAVHPKLLRSWLPFGGRLLQGSSLAPRHRELVILRTAALCGSDYEWGQHVGIGRDAGLSDDEILACGTPPTRSVTPPTRSVMRYVGKSLPNASQNGGGENEDRAVLAATDGLVLHHMVPEEVWHHLVSLGWSDAQLVELTMLAGHYAMLAGMLRSVGVRTEGPLPAIGSVDSTDRHVPDGDAADGDATDGDATDGDATDGEPAG